MLDCLQSGQLLSEMSRLQETGHEARLFGSLERHGLVANIDCNYLEVGLKETHPCLPVASLLNCLDQNGKLDLVINPDASVYSDFWSKWHLLQPKHKIFTHHQGRLSSCIPLLIHADEGIGLKKRPIMILQYQPLFGQGSSRVDAVNYSGCSITTRFLYSVMIARLYSKKPSVLDKLAEHMANEMRSLFYEGITLGGAQVYFITLGLKGDWPALIKLGHLSRSFMRRQRAEGGKASAGVCHLCRAGQPECAWHVFQEAHMDLLHKDVSEPWVHPSPFSRLIPQDASQRANFYKIDLFHTLHKGLFADLAANGIVSQHA